MSSESTPNSERDDMARKFYAEVRAGGSDSATASTAKIGFAAGWDAVLAAGYRRQEETEWEYRIDGPNSVGAAFTTDVEEARERLARFDANYARWGNVHRIQKRRPSGPWVPVTEEGTEHAND